MTTFNDLFKSSFLEKVSSFSALDMVIAMGLALALHANSLYAVFFFFRHLHKQNAAGDSEEGACATSVRSNQY